MGRTVRCVLLVVSMLSFGSAVALAESLVGSPAHVTGAVALGSEVVGLRTEHSRTFQRADGSFEAQVSPRPLNFRDGSGNWKPIDNQLRRRSDGSLRNAAGPAVIDLPARADGAVQISRGDRRLAFSLVGGSSTPARADGDEATFAGALSGVSASYRAQGDSLKETLTLASASAPDRYTFAVDAPGLQAKLAGDGDVVFIDAEGRTQFGFSAPWMQDASGALSRAAHYELKTQGGKRVVVLVLDARWLADPARQFPVKVDPTVYTDIWGVCELRSGAEANVSTCTGGSDPVWVGNDGRVIHRASLGLDPADSGVPTDALITGAEVDAVFDSQSVSEPSDIDLYAGAVHLATPGQTWNTYDGTHAWTTPGGDVRSQRESRRTLDPGWTEGWVGFGMLRLAEQRIQGFENNYDVLLKAADERRMHVDVLEDFVVKVNYRPRTGVGRPYGYQHLDLSDGSRLDVNIANGNVTVSNSDAELRATTGAFSFTRHWNSMDDATRHTFGSGWRGDVGSVALTYDWTADAYVLDGPSGLDGVFVRQPDGSFDTPDGMDARLEEQRGGGLLLTFGGTGDRWTFDSGSPHRLVQIAQVGGDTISLRYASGLLSGVADSDGHTLALAYNGSSDLTTVTDDAGRRRSYTFDASHRLTRFVSAAGATTGYVYSRYGQLTQINLPDGTGEKIAYVGGAGSPPTALTPVSARGVDGNPITFYGGSDYTTVHHAGEHDVTSFYDSRLHVTVVQSTDDPAVAASGSIVHSGTTYDDGSTPYTFNAVGGDIPNGVAQLILEEDRTAVASARATCSSTCPHQFAATLTHDPSRDAEGTHTYRIRVVDGRGNSGYSDTWTVQIDRSPPVNTRAVTIAGDLVRGRTLTLDPGSWSGDGTITYAYQWERCDEEGTCSAISGATGTRYTIAGDDVGSALRATVTASDHGGSTVARSEMSSIIAARGQLEKAAAVQALIQGSLFYGACDSRCEDIVDREAASRDDEARMQMNQLRFALGLYGGNPAPPGGGGGGGDGISSASSRPLAHAATVNTHDLAMAFGPYLTGIRRYTTSPYAVIKVITNTYTYYWRWAAPAGQFGLSSDFGYYGPSPGLTMDVDWVVWRNADDYDPDLNVRWGQTGYFGAYRGDPRRWAANPPNSDPSPCDGRYTARPLGDVSGFSVVRWVDPVITEDDSATPWDDVCASENGALLAHGIGPVGTLRLWTSSDPTPDGTLRLDRFDSSPSPPDPEVIDEDLCRALVSGKYSKADEMLGHPCDEELAQMFRPILKFDSSERWRPLDVDRFLGEQVDGRPLHAICNRPAARACTPLTSTTLLDGSTADSYLSLQSAVTRELPLIYKDADVYRSPDSSCVDGDVLDCDSGPASAIYYHPSDATRNGYRYFDYWAFYRLNYFGSDAISNDYNHQGDWEAVSIAPSKSVWGSFDFAAFSQHDGAWKSYLRENLACIGGAPDFRVGCGTDADPQGARVEDYVASGSHANYPYACSELVFGTCGQDGVDVNYPFGVAVPERGHDGMVEWSRNFDDDALLRMPEPGDGRDFDWSHFFGRWGLATPDDWSGGPQSPGMQTHSVDPTFNQCAVDNSGCALEASISAQPRRQRRGRGLAECDTWFGNDVQALVCIPSRLRRAVRRQQMGVPGSVRIVRFRRGAVVARAAAWRARAESAPGLTQRLGAPLRAGARLRIDGRLAKGTQLRVHLVRNRAALLIVPRRSRGAILAVSRRGKPFLRLSSGRLVRPAQVRTIRP